MAFGFMLWDFVILVLAFSIEQPPVNLSGKLPRWELDVGDGS
jgi:hypothetical protein